MYSRRKTPLIALLLLLIGLALGEWFPDVDQRLDFLVHRSVFTHGLIAPLMLYLIAAANQRSAAMRLFAAGFSGGVAVHLAFDLFPRGWYMHALIHVPPIGWTWPVASWLWIALSIVCSFYFAMKLARGGMGFIALLVGTLGLFAYAGRYENEVWGPLAALLIAMVVAVLWKDSPEH